jgi:hypothetical protein
MQRVDLLETLVDRIVESVTEMEQKFDSVSGAHEAYGLIAEELDEFWDEVKKKEKDRNVDLMVNELIDTAGMALRAALSLKWDAQHGTV